MEASAALTCPKCRGAMRTYERNGIVVDQCEDCRGIFLDRGELERLIDLEGGGHPDDRHGESRPHDRHDHDDDHPRKRRTSPTSLLGDLLGGGGE